MAYYHARSGTCRSDAALSGLINKPMNVQIAGTDAQPLRAVPFTLRTSLDAGGSTCSFVLRDQGEPTLFSSVYFLRGTAADDIFWGGTIIDVKASIASDSNEIVDWAVTARDWVWMLDRFKPVTAVYRDLSVNTILHRILASFTDGGFQGGYCPSSLGTISEIRFDGVTVSQALSQLAKAVSAFVRIRPNLRIDLAQTFYDGASLSIGDTTPIRLQGWEKSGGLIANEITALGRGSQTTAPVAASATTIAVDDTAPFSSAGGLAQVDAHAITYTATSVAAGPGSLTGVSGLADGVEQGARVRVRAVASDSAAQTDLATALGGGRSGVARLTVVDDTWSATEVAGVAASYLAYYKAAVTGLDFEIDDARYVPGMVIPAAITSPLLVSGFHRVQSVETRYEDDAQLDDLDPRLIQTVSLRTTRRAEALDVLVPR